ncbi:MAG: aminotransferase class V-fold PLP-dependent enzyme [Tissierellia bacterium]|nr:aminotransferase class V-fold PLP-dependent enzyme [Tissierellia bacterium]
MKKFYTASDVEYAASRGESSIAINEYDVITDVAREAAEKHNIEFVIGNKLTEMADNRPGESTMPNTGRPISSAVDGRIIAPEYRGLISDQEVETWRREFPILKDAIHVANCSQSAQANRVRGAINRYLDNWLTVGMDWEAWMEEVYFAKAEFAKLINADPSEIAIASSVSETLSSVASFLDYSKGRQKIVATDAEFPTVNYVWLAHQKYGAKVDFIAVNDRHEIELSEYERYIDENTLMTSITQVYYLNGFKQDIAEIAEIAHSKGSLVLADVYQGIGTEPIDVKKMNIDILTTGNLKYLFGLPGVAFMYVNKDLVPMLKPAVTGWFGQDNPFLFQSRYLDWAADASRFDTGTPPVLNAYAARAGLEIVNEVGVDRIKDRVDMLSAHALQGCLDRGLKTISPFDVNKKGATTAIWVSDKIDSGEMETELRKRDIIASARGDVIRVAPHFYTTTQEIDHVLDQIKQILDGK